MIDFDTVVVYFFVGMAVAGFCLLSTGMVVGGVGGVFAMTATHLLGKWLANRRRRHHHDWRRRW